MKKKVSKTLNLTIPPMKFEGKTEPIPIKKIKSGIKRVAEIKDAIVVYVDVLGFSNKIDDKDIENTLLDFSGSLTITSREFPNLRFNVFSDNAFIACHQKDAKNLVAAIRYAFSRWCSNGILVRGGVSLGTYKEFSSVAIQSTTNNFTGNLFSGTAVTSAVRLENLGNGALLFTNNECGKFLIKNFNEPIFSFKNQKLVGWSDNGFTLFQFVANSLFRLLRIISCDSAEIKKIVKKLHNNILYTANQERSGFVHVAILSILSLPTTNSVAKEKVCRLLQLNDPQHFKSWQDLIKTFQKAQKDEIMILRLMAERDSSITKIS